MPVLYTCFKASSVATKGFQQQNIIYLKKSGKNMPEAIIYQVPSPWAAEGGGHVSGPLASLEMNQNLKRRHRHVIRDIGFTDSTRNYK
jgi:hypothetical protein